MAPDEARQIEAAMAAMAKDHAEGMKGMAKEISELAISVAGSTIPRDEYDRDQETMHRRISGQRNEIEGIKAKINKYAGAGGAILGIVVAAVPFIARAF